MFKAKGMIIFTVVAMLIIYNCSSPDSKQTLLSSAYPIHLEEHIDAARVIGSEVPKEIPEEMSWSFDKPQPEWKSVVLRIPSYEPVIMEQTKDSLRLTLTEAAQFPGVGLVGAIYINLPDLKSKDWNDVIIRARTNDKFTNFGLAFNPPAEVQNQAFSDPPVFPGDSTFTISDGSEHTYMMKVSSTYMQRIDPWRIFGIWIASDEPGSIDILSVSVTPREASYADASPGVRAEPLEDFFRRTLYTHTPGRLEYRIQIPEKGRLDFGLGVLRDDVPVSFKVTVKPQRAAEETLFDETYSDSSLWAQRSVDLSHLEGKKAVLALEADSDREGTVAFWSAPTLTGVYKEEKPNVIFYIIDAAGADFMSVYGYDRSNTPNLEKLAKEGIVFENAYSNSTWTKPSNASFMTSLHHSVLGGYTNESDPLPEQAVMMAQHFHQAGYQTAVFTTNANAGSLSDFQRTVDVFRDKMAKNQSTSSVVLQNDFWKWREDFPGEPYWVHFQTTDVHQPYRPVAPFAGKFVSPEMKARYQKWNRQMWQIKVPHSTSIADSTNKQLEKAGIDRQDFYDVIRGLYDETMAHQDHQLGQFVEQLKAKGEWERTLLIIASDHGHPAASYPRFGRGLIDPPVPEWEGAILGSFKTRIPLIFIWPGHIEGGRRLTQQVSMIDMLPTLLDLAGLPMQEMMQGQSLIPLLLGKEGWEQRPVIFDEFYVDLKTGDLIGNIEVIDGRWGASLEIAPMPEEKAALLHRRYQAPATGRWRYPPHEFPNIPRLLLYDLLNDPHALHNINKDRPDLVDKYTKFLEAQWKTHQSMAQHFTRSKESPLTPKQLETLRSLGYIR